MGRWDWRLKLLFRSLLAPRSALPRRLALRSLFTKHRLPYWEGELIRGETDHTAQAVPVKIDKHEYWFPLPALENDVELRREYAFVWDPSDTNPHRYQYGPCRIRPGDTVIDAGACEGFFARFALDAGAGKVIAVEPGEQMCHCLHRTFEREIAEGRVEIRRLCLGVRRETAHMGSRTASPFALQRTSPGEPCDDHEEVPVDTLDSVLDAGCDFLKMDIEGDEVCVLQACRLLLGLPRIRMAITAYHRPGDGKALKRIIDERLPNHASRLRGIRWPGGEAPRPMMLYAWPRAGRCCATMDSQG